MPGDRLASSFEQRARPTGLIPYLTAGYPSLAVTLELLREAAPHSVAIELGVPFSDPIADGPDIQRAADAALAQGVGASQVLDLVARYRAGGGAAPIVIMTYLNPILRPDIQAFAHGARDAGADAVLVSDLPPDESPEVWQALDHAGLATVTLVAPTTSAERLPLVVERARGFVYCLARTGVTGQGGGYAGSIEERVREVRRHSRLPVAVGFGISTAAQARALRGVADGVVVGAALMREVAQDPDAGVVARVTTRVQELAGVLAG